MKLIYYQLLVILSGVITTITYTKIQQKILDKSETLSEHKTKLEKLKKKEKQDWHDQLDTIISHQTIHEEKWKDKKFLSLFIISMILFFTIITFAIKYHIFWQYFVIILITNIVMSKL